MATATLDGTVGSASANTYALLVDAEQYYDNRFVGTSTVWSAESDANKNKALLFAAKLMDSLIEWNGWAVTPDTQAMLWPRSGLTTRTGKSIDTDVVPQPVKDCQSEFARQLLVDVTRTDDSATETQGIKSLTAGPVSLEFNEDVAAKVLPDLAYFYLNPEWFTAVRGRATSTRPMIRSY
jgi:hypothetical protein